MTNLDLVQKFIWKSIIFTILDKNRVITSVEVEKSWQNSVITHARWVTLGKLGTYSTWLLHTQWWKKCFPAKTEKFKMSLITSVQHYTRCTSPYIRPNLKKKGHNDWKGKSKAILFINYIVICRIFKGIHTKKSTRTIY